MIKIGEKKWYDFLHTQDPDTDPGPDPGLSRIDGPSLGSVVGRQIECKYLPAGRELGRLMCEASSSWLPVNQVIKNFLLALSSHRLFK